MKIKNTTTRDLGLSPEVVIPAGGEVEIENEALTALKASPVVKAWLIDGWLVEDDAVKPDAAPAGDPLMRFDIVSGIIRGLTDDAYNQSGKPDLAAINKAMPKTSERVSGAERDAVWAEMQAT